MTELLLCAALLPWALLAVYLLRQRRRGGKVLQLALYRAQRRRMGRR